MTCTQALEARYKVVGHNPATGVSEAAFALGFNEAHRYWKSLHDQGLDVYVVACTKDLTVTTKHLN